MTLETIAPVSNDPVLGLLKLPGRTILSQPNTVPAKPELQHGEGHERHHQSSARENLPDLR